MSPGDVDADNTVSLGVRKTRHRPRSLNLSNMNISKITTSPTPETEKSDNKENSKDSVPEPVKSVGLIANEDLALRIVSPGLPQLNTEMKYTIKLSQQIHMQQSRLIAAREKGQDAGFDDAGSELKDDHEDIEDKDVSDSNDKSNDNDNDKDNHEKPHEFKPEGTQLRPIVTSDKTPITSTIVLTSPSNDSSKLTTPVSARGLKRPHVPAPLSINANSNSNTLHPAIHSAPMIASKLKVPPPSTSKQLLTTPNTTVKFPPYLTPHKHSPYQSKRVKIQQTPSYPLQPHTAGAQFFPRSRYSYQQYTPQPSARLHPFYPQPYYAPALHPVPSSESGHSTPVLSQSSSLSQALQLKGAHIDTPVQYVFYNGSTPQFLRAPKEPPQEQPAPPNSRSTAKVLDVYQDEMVKEAPLQSQPLSSRQEIFECNDKLRKSSLDDDRLPVSEDEVREMEEKYSRNNEVFNPNEIFGSINLMNRKFFNFRIFDKNNRAETSDLKPEKEKFLKICEKTWDEFVSDTRKQ